MFELENIKYQETTYERILIASRSLHYLFQSICKRQLYYEVDPTFQLSQVSICQLDQMIENVFRVVEFQLARKQLTFKIQIVGAPPS